MSGMEGSVEARSRDDTGNANIFDLCAQASNHVSAGSGRDATGGKSDHPCRRDFDMHNTLSIDIKNISF